MIRKHTRRAAKAAFAISLGVAIVFGLFAAVRAAGAREVDGHSDDHHRHEELPRGVHPRRALQAGARGEGLQRLLQGEHRLDRDDPDGPDEREDQLLPRVHRRDRAGRLPHANSPKTAARRTRSRSSSRRRRATRVLKPTPFYDTDVLAVTNATAKKYGLKTIADLKKVGQLQARRLPGVQDAQHVLPRLHEAVRADERVVRCRSPASRPTRRSTPAPCWRPTCSRPTRRSARARSTRCSADPKHMTGFQNVAPIVKTSRRDGARLEVHRARSTRSRRS